jgi:hypothetical protein
MCSAGPVGIEPTTFDSANRRDLHFATAQQSTPHHVLRFAPEAYVNSPAGEPEEPWIQFSKTSKQRKTPGGLRPSGVIYVLTIFWLVIRSPNLHLHTHDSPSPPTTSVGGFSVGVWCVTGSLCRQIPLLTQKRICVIEGSEVIYQPCGGGLSIIFFRKLKIIPRRS